MEQQMKILFLDIDGVLNSMDNEYSRLYLWKKGVEKSKDEYDMLRHQNFVRTDKRFGLDYHSAKEIIKILNSNESN